MLESLRWRVFIVDFAAGSQYVFGLHVSLLLIWRSDEFRGCLLLLREEEKKRESLCFDLLILIGVKLSQKTYIACMQFV
jgi:hypothetical protein